MLLNLKYSLGLCAISCLYSVSQAATYVCQDQYGNKIYTDKSKDSCHSPSLGKLNTYAPIHYPKPKKPSTNLKKTGNNKAASQTGNKTNSKLTNNKLMVSTKTQQQRDLTRKQILINELENEVTALNNAKKQLQQFKSVQNEEQLKKIETEIIERKQNIDVINKEIARI